MNQACLTTPDASCSPSHCHWRCAPEVIDELLAQPNGVSGEETDLLLELRWHLHSRTDAEGALRLFCDLRRRMEARHYLAFFRMRRWIENHVLAAVSSCPTAVPRNAPVKLDYYCVEAVRRSCLCRSLARGEELRAPRVRFLFRDLSVAPRESAEPPERAVVLGASA